MHTGVSHDDVIKWKHYKSYWPFVRGIHRSSVNSPHKGQWRGPLIFSLICSWKRLSKQSRGGWFEMPPRSSWRYRNEPEPPSPYVSVRKISAISNETGVPVVPFITPTKYFNSVYSVHQSSSCDSRRLIDVNPLFTAPGCRYYFKINSYWFIAMP